MAEINKTEPNRVGAGRMVGFKDTTYERHRGRSVAQNPRIGWESELMDSRPSLFSPRKHFSYERNPRLTDSDTV